MFGANRYRNEIVWCYTGPGSPGMRQFNRKHDTLLWYTRGDKWVFNRDAVRVAHAKLNTNRRGAMIADALTPEERDIYLAKGKVPETWWPEFSPVGRIKSERLGYPTQKPRKLLERIVEACSGRGDVVLDPFCGCGTAIDAARRMGRRWVGIDISAFAVDLIREKRFKDKSIPAFGIPADMAAARKLARERPFDFESWAVTRLPGFAPNTRQRGDGGIDGRGKLAITVNGSASRDAFAQIKGGRFTVDSFRAFGNVIHRDGAALGCFITLDPVTSPSALREASMMGARLLRGSRVAAHDVLANQRLFRGATAVPAAHVGPIHRQATSGANVF